MEFRRQSRRQLPRWIWWLVGIFLVVGHLNACALIPQQQKVVLKVQMENKEKQSKVMQLIAKHCGVSSVEVKGDDKVEVVGIGVDAVALTTVLRKRMRRHAGIDSVTAVDDKEKKKKEEDTWPRIVTYPLYISEPRQQSDCCIM